MKHFYLLLAAVFFSLQFHAQNAPFITTWEVTAGSLDISIPTGGLPGSYNYTIDFGDGTVQNIVTHQLITHTYNNPGIYTVSIIGDFPRIAFGLSSQLNRTKIMSVEQWGDIQWQSMEKAFEGCPNLVINATDAPDLSQVTTMAEMFKGSFSFNQSINHWDVSNVTNMYRMFSGASSFNQPLNNWDVSNVTDMSLMFEFATSFNQPLSNWDVSNVTNMMGMFFSFPQNANTFNQSLNNWNTASVTHMSQMFYNLASFNQPLNSWNVSNVKDMFQVFSGAISFNQPLNNWDVSNVTYMGYMFQNAQSFNQPLNDWDTSNVDSMPHMFNGASLFNQPLNNWDISEVIWIYGMFYNASNFNQDISNWNFNDDVVLHTTFTSNAFLSFSGLDNQNYDKLLLKFAQLGLENKTLTAQDIYYCDLDVRNHLINVLGWTIWSDSLGMDCPNNMVFGNILFDMNGDGCDNNDLSANNIIISANNNSFDYSTISDDGEYFLYLMEDTYTISLSNIPNYFTVTPATTTISFTGSNNVEEVNFCLTATQSIEDLNIILLPTSEARPGFEAEYRLVVKNVGTETIANVTATLDFDDTMQQFVSAIPAPGSTTTNSLTFTIGNMHPFQTFEIDITMLTFQPPTVEGDDILNFIAEITPSTNDHTPNDNMYNLAQVVVNSYDPNDKQVLQGEEIHIDNADEYLDYLIRFQNMGTASAINVRILDTLHHKLDWSTFTPISASHDYYINITEGNRVELMFDNIHLPHEDDDEPASHGFVAYKIKPKSNVQVGDVISGDAAIYFDFNAPIITNMVHTQIVDPLGLADNPNPLNYITVYPNPTNKTLNIFLTEGIQLEEVKIYDLQGKEVQTFQGNEKILDLENLSRGMYFLKITTDRGAVNRKFVKE